VKDILTRRGWFFLVIILIVAGLLAFFSLTRGHPWWDDFAGYMLQTRSILSWNMGQEIQHNTFTVETSSYPPGPAAYPWGFPLLLLPVYVIFGLNPLTLKLVGVFFFLAFLISFYLLARTRLSESQSLLLVALLAYAPVFVAAQDLILSDIPFLFFSTLALFFMERGKGAGIAWRLFSGFLIFMASFLRTTGILLFVPLFMPIILIARSGWQEFAKRVAPTMLSFGLLYFLQSLIFPGGQGSYFSHFSMFNLPRLIENLLYYLWLPAWLFDRIPAGVALYPLLLILVIISLPAFWRRDLSLHAYGLSTLLAFIVWPERQGLRFIYPILPFFLISAFEGLSIVMDRLPQAKQGTVRNGVFGFWSLVVLVCLGISSIAAVQNMAAGRDINGPFDQYSNQMYEYIREQTDPASVIVFMRPRALRLFTGRDAFMTEDCSDLSQGDYIVLHQKLEANGQVSPQAILACSPALRLEETFRNKRFLVYHRLQ
jgi:hypothetical protein